MAQPTRPKVKVLTQAQRARRGTLWASLLAAGFVVGAGWLVLFSGPGTRTAPVPAPPKSPKDTRGGADAASRQGDVLAMEQVRIDLLDRDEPSRKAGRLEFAQMDPLEDRNYLVSKPDAWIYLKNGGVVRVRAASGKIYMPERGREPQSGSLSGGVTIESYAPRAGRPLPPEASERPAATLTTPTLSFDTLTGSLTTNESLTFASADADFEGTGLNLLYNRVKQRIELLEVTQGKELRLRQRPREKAPAATAAPSAAPGEAPAATPAPGAPAPSTPAAVEEVRYTLRLGENVRVLQAQRELEADTLTIWARLVNGRLPEGAIAPVRVPRGQGGTSAAVATVAAPVAKPVSAGDALAKAPETTSVPAAPDAATSEDVIVRWDGPLLATPIEETPEELSRDHVALRFTAERRGAVAMRDPERSFAGKAGLISYGATSRRLVLDAAGSAAPELELGTTGGVLAERIEADLTAGLVRMPGRATLRLTGDRGASVTAAEQTDITFAAPEDGQGGRAGELRQAAFSGDVVARLEDGSSLDAGFARVDFAAGRSSDTQGKDSSVKSVIARFVAEGKVALQSEAGSVRAERVDVGFEMRDGQRSSPRVFTAEKGVVVQRGFERLSGELIEAQLESIDGKTQVASARIDGGASYRDEIEGLDVRADSIRADLTLDEGSRRQRVDLLGNATITRQGTTIAGDQARLDGRSTAMEVFGAGRFEHTAPANEPQKIGRINATWTGGMTYDDRLGRLECKGQVRGVSSPDELTRDTIAAEQLVVMLTPRSESPAPGAAAEPGIAGGSRQLVSAEVLGDEGTRASVETRRYRDASSKELERLAYLEGGRILLGSGGGALEVPGAGKLLVRDVSQASAGAPGGPPAGVAPAPMPSGEAKGDALFDWTDSLTFERASGDMRMGGDVHLTHRRASDQLVTTMRCDRLDARLVGGDGRGASGSLSMVRATGNVGVAAGPAGTSARELSADTVEYDTIAGILAARAEPGASVLMVEPARGTTVRARGIVWNLGEDRISIEGPQPIIVPR